MSYSSTGNVITVESRGAVDIVTMNRPDQLNAINIEMAEELTHYFTEAKGRRDVRVVILRGEGKHFSAGADLDSDAFVPSGEGRAQKQMDMQHLYSGLVKVMRQCPQPIIALMQGAAVGGGFSLSLAADVRIAAPSARMNAGYIRIGLGGCDMGSGYFLPRLVGVSAASEILLTGNFVNADRALAIGLVSQIVGQESLLDEGIKIAEAMTLASPMGLRLTKESINSSLGAASLESVLTMEDRQQVILLDTEDHREAVKAFLEKRTPVYRDC